MPAKPKPEPIWSLFAIASLPVDFRTNYPVVKRTDSAGGAVVELSWIMAETRAEVVCALTPNGWIWRNGSLAALAAMPPMLRGELVHGNAVRLLLP